MTASARIDESIMGLTDWRGCDLARIRKIIHEADPAHRRDQMAGSPGLVARRQHLRRRAPEG